MRTIKSQWIEGTKVDEEALKRANDSLYATLGPMDDLTPELRNTLANVYYNFYALSQNMRNPFQIFCRDKSNPMTSYMEFMKDSADVLADFTYVRDMIKSMREARKQDQNIYEYLVTLTLDTFKYKISNAHQKTGLRRAIERIFKIPNEIEGLYDRMDKIRGMANEVVNNTGSEGYVSSHKTESKESIQSKDIPDIGSGILAHQEIKAVTDIVEKYLSQFGDKKPDSITLNTYEWAVMDLTLRQATGNIGNLHIMSYNDLKVYCKAGRCYCHHFLDDPGVRDIVKTIYDYTVVMGDKSPTKLPIDAAARQKLNARFEYFFDGAFNLDSKPHLASHVIRVTGQELYKTNYT